jgi:multidrug resistance efflux pump
VLLVFGPPCQLRLLAGPEHGRTIPLAVNVLTRAVGCVLFSPQAPGAYFEETKIRHIRPGASAEIYLMDGSPTLQGTVSGISMGITDQDNKDGPELLSSVNPTFTWVRLAQRIPVRVHITHVPPGVLVSAGMTCTVVIKEGATPQLGTGMKKVMTAIFGAPSS